TGPSLLSVAVSFFGTNALYLVHRNTGRRTDLRLSYTLSTPPGFAPACPGNLNDDWPRTSRPGFLYKRRPVAQYTNSQRARMHPAHPSTNTATKAYGEESLFHPRPMKGHSDGNRTPAEAHT